ncbi:MAG: competence protein TfoX [Eubacteriales bacterium]|nr:competence protein TfoX [Eubacteriales bacterium]
MASSKEYMTYIAEQTACDELSWRPMMGEYLLYYRGRVIGGIYDDRLLLKPTAAAKSLLPDAPREIPYPGAKEMLLVSEVDDGEALLRLLLTIGSASQK